MNSIEFTRPANSSAKANVQSAAAIASGASLEVRGLIKRYGEHVAVDGITWKAEAGEFIALLGSSGCGKSTTLLMIAGLVAPTAGEVLIAGTNVTNQPPERRNIGMVFQDYALFPHLSVRDNVTFGLRMRSIAASAARQGAEKVLERVGLNGFADRMPAALSGGQRQRVALARALVYEPPVLLMDEPLGALDKQLREQMQLELRRLHRELGLTILYVTHDQREALTMADRLAVMRAGRIEQIGTPESVFRRPSTRFVASFIGDCCFLIPGAVAKGTDGTWMVSLDGWTGEASGPAVLAARPEVAVRPYDIKVGPRGSGLPATIVDVVFEGETYEYLMVSRDGQKFSARAAAADHLRLRQSTGSEVGVCWQRDAAWLV